jgi:hypothetical protein
MKWKIIGFTGVWILSLAGLPLLAATPIYPEAFEVYPVAGVIIGLIAFVWGILQIIKKLRMDRAVSTDIRSLAPGFVRISGKALSWHPLTAPGTQKPCVYYDLKVEEVEHTNRGDHYILREWDVSNDYPFYLDDGTGVITVYPTGSETRLVTRSAGQRSVGEETDFLKDRHLSTKKNLWGGTNYRTTEKHIEPGDRVYVIGTCKADSGNPADKHFKFAEKTPPPPTAKRGLCIGKAEGNLFMIMDKDPKGVERTMFALGLLTLVGGAAGAAFLIWHFMKV